MKTSLETSRSELPEPTWRVAMAEFRARAQRLFEAQCDRVIFLETCVAEQLAALDQADEGSSSTSPEGSQAAPGSPATSSKELEQLQTQLTQCRKLLNARAGELRQLRSLLAEQAENVEGVEVEALLEQLAEMRLERDELIGRLADAERQLKRTSDEDSAPFEELQRRFEVAVREIRELKAKNDELQRKPSRAEVNSHDAPAAPTSGFNWEQQKLRLMQQLDSDFNTDEPNDRRTKLSIESTIQITDQVIADKDRQIAELKALLEDKSDLSNEHLSAALLDSDEQIREERERLSRLEEQWRDKLRQAEIDISVERAKLARERSEIDAKLRSFEESGGGSAEGKSVPKQPGRWLTRLGLKDDDK